MSRSIGFWRCWALVVGSMIGSGVFMLPAVLAPYGKYSVLGWLISGAGTILIALTLGRLARRSPHLGGPYAYVREAFGEIPGFYVGWGHWISYVLATASIAVAFVGYLAFFWPQLASEPALAGVTAIALIWITTGVNISGVGSVGVLQLVTTLLKLLPLFIVAVGGIYLGDFESVPSKNPDEQSVIFLIASMVMITMWAYTGIENGSVPADDVIDPGRTIPKALLFGTLTGTAIYVAAGIGVMALVPLDELGKSTAPFADAAVYILGAAGASLVAMGAMISPLGAMNGNTLAAGMLSRAIALDRLFPDRMGQLNNRGVPQFSLVLAGLIASVLIGMNFSRGLVSIFELLILLSTLATLLPYAASAVAELLLQQRDNSEGKSVHLIARLTAIAAFSFSLFAIVGSGLEIALQGFILLLLGTPVWYFSRRSHQIY